MNETEHSNRLIYYLVISWGARHTHRSLANLHRGDIRERWSRIPACCWSFGIDPRASRSRQPQSREAARRDCCHPRTNRRRITAEPRRGVSMKANDDRHDHSVETTWNAMLDLEKRFSTNVLWDLLSMQTLRDLENQNAGMYTLIAGTHPVDSVQEQLLEGAVDRVRPFLGETLYDIFSIHRAVVFRAAFDLHCVVCEQSDEHWLTDQLVHNALDGLIDFRRSARSRGRTSKTEAKVLCRLCGSSHAYAYRYAQEPRVSARDAQRCRVNGPRRASAAGPRIIIGRTRKERCCFPGPGSGPLRALGHRRRAHPDRQRRLLRKPHLH